MNDNDRVRLRHMLDAAREVKQFINNQTRQSLDDNVMLTRALSWSIGVIGEAASRVSDAFQAETPQLPWPKIIGMRNRLIHAYFDINLDRLWDTATTSIPELVVELEKILSMENE